MSQVEFVDPPSGWMYGFPKCFPYPRPEGFDVLKWIIEQGYPQKEVDKFGDNFICRHWIDDVEN